MQKAVVGVLYATGILLLYQLLDNTNGGGSHGETMVQAAVHLMRR
jgi:hypothetical protein